MFYPHTLTNKFWRKQIKYAGKTLSVIQWGHKENKTKNV